MHILFRCDAGTQIGLGHLMRCLTLADALHQHGASCLFICRPHPGFPLSLLQQSAHEYRLLPDAQRSVAQADALAHADWLGATQEQDLAQTRALIGNQMFDWLVTDHYALDQRWQQALRGQARHILAIDDLADRSLDCDVLLDQNLGRKASDYTTRVPAHCQRLVGLQHALLRPEFPQWREASLQRRQQAPLIRRLMISLGGVDQHNISGRVLQALQDTRDLSELEIELILGPTAPHIRTVQKQLAQYPVAVEFNIGVSDMARRLAATDLVIGAAGSSAWERCCLGVPSLVLVLADNQRSLAQTLQASGAALQLDQAQADDFALRLQTSLDQCRQRLAHMQDAAAELLDGRGTQRLCQTLLSA